VNPESPQELAKALACASARGDSVRVVGCDSKRAMAGPNAPAAVEISTAALNRVLKYEPGDLTISVEAGMRYADLAALLAGNGQMLPLDPPFTAQATVGGVVAANTSGPRRRLYGTARDFVIGMQFATLEGKLVQTGGMVVKNVAGLDMGKLMIGSFGTLAGIASVNFKLVPAPPETRTLLLRFDTLRDAAAQRSLILNSVLQPAALDLFNPAAGFDGFVVAVQAGGNAGLLGRYARELSAAEVLEGEQEEAFWTAVREFTPRFLAEHANGAVARVSSVLGDLSLTDAPAIARGGVIYHYFESAQAAAEFLRGKRGVVEYAPEREKARLDLWPCPGPDLDLMRRVKHMFDPRGLLNGGRLYGRI
jgi:glycolate oxidase FAD binding subunit